MKTPKLNNSGSGLVTVLVCVMFLVALGLSLLFVSYTGVAVRTVEQASEQTFYDAESAMDVVRLEVQDCVALALGNAWQDTLTHYSEIVEGKPQDQVEDALQAGFTTRFKTALQAGDLFNDTAFNIEWFNTALKTALAVGEDPLTGGSTVLWDDPKTGAVAVLQGLTLTYKDGGYKDVIKTDIAIYAPPFSYQPTPSVAGVSPTALIAGAGLSVLGGDHTINGNAYAGYISVNGNLTYDKGKLVTRGDVYANNYAHLTGDTDSELWCGGINLGTKAKLTTTGNADIHCYGDLTFNGNEAEATLSGTYTGFGFENVTGDALYSADSAPRNSSIIINGRNSILDMDKLESLILAGNAYISKDGDNADVLMGQSIATRSDQLIYLVPESYLTGILDSNPCILPEGMTALTDEQLTEVVDKLSTLNIHGYNITGVQPVYSQLVSHDIMVYLFIRFGTRAGANNYFKNFYKQYNDYAALYLEKCIKAQNTIAAGNTYTRTGGADIFIDPDNNTNGIDGVRAQCIALGRSWNSLCRTLTENGTTTSANLYDYYVNSSKVNTLPDGKTLFSDTGGNVIGCVSRGDCEVPACFGSGSPPVGRLLICDGDVTVDKAFNGLIISSGTVTMKGNGSVAASNDTALSLLAKNGENTLISYLNGGDAALSGSGDTDNGGNWDMSALVSYVNWRKADAEA